MSLVTMLKSRKAFAGMVAVAAGTATVAAPVVALPLSADPSGDSTASPAVNGGDAGTYESCSALFGLTDKSNANYVTFNVAGTAVPLPGIGQGLIPVITVTDPGSGDVDECVPEIGFDDAESWFAYLQAGSGELVEPVVPYPGTTGYLIPASRGVVTPVGTAAPAEPAPAPLSIALRIETDSTVNSAVTVTWGPSELVYPETDYEAVGGAIIVDELGGPTSPLGIRFTELVIDGTGDCSNPPEQIDIDLAAALFEITGVPQSFFDEITTGTCDQIFLASSVRVGQLFVDDLGLAASVTVNAATPGPGPGPGPSPTPGPAPTPVTPRFTG